MPMVRQWHISKIYGTSHLAYMDKSFNTLVSLALVTTSTTNNVRKYKIDIEMSILKPQFKQTFNLIFQNVVKYAEFQVALVVLKNWLNSAT